ncbi:glycosyltransferase [Acetobacter ghanensis]|nr:glycosyltransferase [Acetobacter ghanensis]
MRETWEPDAAEVAALVARRQEVLHQPTAAGMAEVCAALCHAGRNRDAVSLALEVVAAHPHNAPLVLAAADVMAHHTPRLDIVVALLRQVVALEPHNLAYAVRLAAALVEQGDVAGGCALYEEVMARAPAQRPVVGQNLAATLLRVGRPMEALHLLYTLVAEGPPDAALLATMGAALVRLNRSGEALLWYQQALELEPHNTTTALNYAFALLKAGQYGKGWAWFAHRPPQTNGLTHWLASVPQLQRDDVAQANLAGKKVVLYQEQGFGDTLQFIRFAAGLVGLGAQVSIATYPMLVRLLAMSFPSMTVCSLPDMDRNARYDYALPVPYLPSVMGMQTAADIPATVPYLRADPADVARFAALLPAGRPRIGLVWSGERRGTGRDVLADQLRSTTLEVMAQALTPVDATLVSLQFGAPRADLAAWHGQPIFDPMEHVQDMADTAAIMDNLDLIISVDTSPLHLAGALGKSVWMVSRWDACWRWGDAGEQTPWYPTMRIFRPQERTFGPVLQQVGAALQTWVATIRRG